MTIKRIGVMSLAKFYGVMMGLIGLIIGAIAAIGGVISGTAMSGDFLPAAGALLGVIGVIAIILLPLFYGILGFIMGALTALLFNLSTKIVGGVKIETEQLA